jgi:cytochrome c biogenesis protein ResB
LVVVLACCVVGVTVVRGVRAGELIFATLWFNGLLVLLALSSAAAFFTRIWRRKLTLVSAGMILFHVSFLAMLGGIVFNSLFHFRGTLRLTEGETVPNGQIGSYDEAERGRFFDLSRLRGDTTLVKTHVNLEVDGENKRIAYEVLVEDGESKKQGIIYATQNLVFNGVRYFNKKEGYSVLLVIFDKDGREFYGLHVPLQSYRRDDGTYRYATGTAEGEAAFAFPQPPEEPRTDVAFSFRPSAVGERKGDVAFRVIPLGTSGHEAAEKRGEVPIGGQFDAGDFKLSPKEIRYWVAMDVRYDPGLNVILASLCFGLLGMVLTFVGRLRQGGARRRVA